MSERAPDRQGGNSGKARVQAPSGQAEGPRGAVASQGHRGRNNQERVKAARRPSVETREHTRRPGAPWTTRPGARQGPEKAGAGRAGTVGKGQARRRRAGGARRQSGEAGGAGASTEQQCRAERAAAGVDGGQLGKGQAERSVRVQGQVCCGATVNGMGKLPRRGAGQRRDPAERGGAARLGPRCGRGQGPARSIPPQDQESSRAYVRAGSRHRRAPGSVRKLVR